MLDFEEKVDDLSDKLVNSKIQVPDIPDEYFIAVAKRVMYALPVPTMEAVAVRLSCIVERLKIEGAQKQQLLEQKRHELEELERQALQTDTTG